MYYNQNTMVPNNVNMQLAEIHAAIQDTRQKIMQNEFEMKKYQGTVYYTQLFQRHNELHAHLQYLNNLLGGNRSYGMPGTAGSKVTFGRSSVVSDHVPSNNQTFGPDESDDFFSDIELKKPNQQGLSSMVSSALSGGNQPIPPVPNFDVKNTPEYLELQAQLEKYKSELSKVKKEEKMSKVDYSKKLFLGSSLGVPYLVEDKNIMQVKSIDNNTVNNTLYSREDKEQCCDSFIERIEGYGDYVKSIEFDEGDISDFIYSGIENLTTEIIKAVTSNGTSSVLKLGPCIKKKIYLGTFNKSEFEEEDIAKSVEEFQKLINNLKFIAKSSGYDWRGRLINMICKYISSGHNVIAKNTVSSDVFSLQLREILASRLKKYVNVACEAILNYGVPVITGKVNEETLEFLKENLKEGESQFFKEEDKEIICEVIKRSFLAEFKSIKIEQENDTTSISRKDEEVRENDSDKPDSIVEEVLPENVSFTLTVERESYFIYSSDFIKQTMSENSDELDISTGLLEGSIGDTEKFKVNVYTFYRLAGVLDACVLKEKETNKRAPFLIGFYGIHGFKVYNVWMIGESEFYLERL